MQPIGMFPPHNFGSRPIHRLRATVCNGEVLCLRQGLNLDHSDDIRLVLYICSCSLSLSFLGSFLRSSFLPFSPMSIFSSFLHSSLLSIIISFPFRPLLSCSLYIAICFSPLVVLLLRLCSFPYTPTGRNPSNAS